MSDYRVVQEALASGQDPALLCATCPWDRYCVTPPSMTKAEIDRHMEHAKEQDEDERRKARAEGRGEPSMPVASLMTAIAFGGRDTAASCCPVFALRLRSSDGRKIVDPLKRAMQKWADD